MRRTLIAIYLGIYLISPLPWIGTPDTLGGSVVLGGIAALALAMGALAVTGRVPRYGSEVAILATVPFLVVLMGEGAYPMCLFIPVQIVLGERLASRVGSSARPELARHGGEEHRHDDDAEDGVEPQQ